MKVLVEYILMTLLVFFRGHSDYVLLASSSISTPLLIHLLRNMMAMLVVLVLVMITRKGVYPLPAPYLSSVCLIPSSALVLFSFSTVALTLSFSNCIRSSTSSFCILFHPFLFFCILCYKREMYQHITPHI